MSKTTNKKLTPILHTKDTIAKQLVQHQVQLKSLKEEFEALHKKLAALTAKEAPGQQDIDTNFIATGPASNGFGFLSVVDSTFSIGMFGIGSNGNTNEVKNSIGVMGTTSFFTAVTAGSSRLDTGNGRGVVGTAAGDGGIGVQGAGTKNSTGVQGISEGGVAVNAISHGGVGVEAFGEIGVFALGTGIGVQGASEIIGVLGGNPTGVLNPNIFMGVAGQAPNAPEDFTFSYGGWFGRGPGIQGGTAPIHLEPATAADPNPPQAAQRGDLLVDNAGALWFCTDTGDANPNPATWKKVQLV